MNLMLRLYWPKETPPSILDGSWLPPKVQIVAPRQAGPAPGTDGTAQVDGASASPAPIGTRPAPVAGISRRGIVTGEIEVDYKGWSVQRFLNQNVYNDKGVQIGFVNDIIVSPDKVVTYAIIGTGGFLGFDERNVALPIGQFKLVEGEIVLPNVTPASVASMPAFLYVDSDFRSATTE
jgi:sporulation protein YlmC with PRC-barrel domain